MKRLGTKVLALAALLVFSAQAQANPLASYKEYGFSSETEMKNYFTITNVSVKVAEGEASEAPQNTPKTQPSESAGDLIKDIGGIFMGQDQLATWVSLGLRVWNLVKDNRPIASVSTQRVAVIPASVQSWNEMENWKGPAVKTYTVEAVNGYGVAVISHTYTVAMNYGGSFNGAGQYIMNATIIPTNVDVMWGGFELNSEVEVGNALNTATKDNPVPALDLQLKWQMRSILSHLQGNDAFYISGDGKINFVNGQN